MATSIRAVRGVVPGEIKEKNPLTVILMHGFGAPGHDLVGLAEGLDLPPGTELIFPEAPLELAALTGMPAFGDARAWWLIDMERIQRAMMRGEPRNLREVPDGLVEAREAIDMLLASLVKEGKKPERIVLGGFSQGSMLALDVVLRSSLPIGGLVILSGTIIAEDEWTPLLAKAARSGLRVFQSHGTEDPILPFEVAEKLRDALRTAGLDVEFHSFAGGHGIPPRVLSSLDAWLGKI
jgi:phospholipase/carboxylesterase